MDSECPYIHCPVQLLCFSSSTDWLIESRYLRELGHYRRRIKVHINGSGTGAVTAQCFCARRKKIKYNNSTVRTSRINGSFLEILPHCELQFFCLLPESVYISCMLSFQYFNPIADNETEIKNKNDKESY